MSAASSSSTGSKPTGIPLAEQFELPSRNSSPSPVLGRNEHPTLRSSIRSTIRSTLHSRFCWKVSLLLFLCCLRIEFFRQVTRNSECVSAGYTVRWIYKRTVMLPAANTLMMDQYALPFTISIYDYWRNQRSRSVESYDSSQSFQNLPLMVVYSTFRRGWYYLTQSRFRGVIAAILLSLGGYLASSFWAGSQSNYICPLVHQSASRIQGIRLANVLVDSALLIGFTELSQRGFGAIEARGKRTLTTLGACLLVS